MGDEVVSAVGRIFSIELPEPATSGYVWSLATLPPELHLVKEQRQTPAVWKPGAGLRHTFQIKAFKPGQYKLDFHLKRSWDPKSVNVKTVNVHVDG